MNWPAIRAVVDSVRARLTILSVVLVTGVLVVNAVVLTVLQQQQLISAVDDILQQRADDLIGLAVAGDMPEVLADIDDDDSLAQLVTTEGLVLAASARAIDAPPLTPPVDRTRAVTARTPVDNEDFRVLSVPLQIEGTAAVLHVATSVEFLGQSRRALLRAQAVSVPLAVLVLAAMVWWLVGRTLAPVAAIQTEVAAIGGGQLGRRVPDLSRTDEIGRLARLMNQMLGRLDDADRRQRRFVADAAHELRSPLTRIRSELEVDLAHPHTSDPDRTRRSVLSEAIGMQRLVEDLLLLARHDEGVVPLRRSDVDLRALVEGLSPPQHSDIAVTLAGDDAPVVVQADRDQLRRAISNLVDNAVRYAASTVVVAVTGDHAAKTARVTVTDDGPGIPPAWHDAVFQRFVRIDDARSARDGGAGLGLAIARQVAEFHGGSLQVDPDRTQGARLVLTVPAVATDTASPAL